MTTARSASASGEKPSVTSAANANPARQPRCTHASATAIAAAPHKNGYAPLTIMLYGATTARSSAGASAALNPYRATITHAVAADITAAAITDKRPIPILAASG